MHPTLAAFAASYRHRFTDLTITELAKLVCEVVGFHGEIRFDASKPDGTPRKLLDVGRMQALGWTPRVGLRDGLRRTYAWFLEHRHDLRTGAQGY